MKRWWRRTAASTRGFFARLRRAPLANAAAVVIGLFMLVALCADFLASDRPIACRFHHERYWFPNVTRPAALDGYDCQRIAAERALGDWSIDPLVRFGPRAPSIAGATEAAAAPALLPPFAQAAHPLGTDGFGRDVFARLVHGARTSFVVALLAVFAFVSVGCVLGAAGGFVGGLFDGLVARLVETLSAFPTLVLVLVVQSLLPNPTLSTFLLAIGLSRGPEVARLVRAEVLVVSSQDYVTAARALGAPPWRVLARHVLPNAKAPIVVAAVLGFAQVVLIEASLSFLRVGVPPETVSWGEMLSEVRDHPDAYWLLVVPGLALFLLVLALNVLGEALRDLLDPRLRA